MLSPTTTVSLVSVSASVAFVVLVCVSVLLPGCIVVFCSDFFCTASSGFSSAECTLFASEFLSVDSSNPMIVSVLLISDSRVRIVMRRAPNTIMVSNINMVDDI